MQIHIESQIGGREDGCNAPLPGTRKVGNALTGQGRSHHSERERGVPQLSSKYLHVLLR